MSTSRDHRRTGILGRAVAVVASASAVVTGLTVRPASAATPLACGTVVTRSVTLSNDITDCPGDGLVIGAPEITIDLNGHRVTAVGNGSVSGVGNGQGINNSGGYDRVVIKNGRIENFLFGARLADATKNEVSNVTFNKVLYGVFLVGSQETIVADNALIGLRDGDAGIGIRVDGNKNGVYRNTLRDFRWNGIYVTDPSTGTDVVKNTVSVGGYGIYVNGQDTKVLSNKVRWNLYYGIAVDGPHCYDDGSCYEGGSGLLKGNLADYNGYDGIAVDTAATTLTSNQANYNTGRGISGAPGMTDGGGNRATGNGVTPQCTYVVCS